MTDAKRSHSQKHGNNKSIDCSETILFDQFKAEVNAIGLVESTAFDVEQLVMKFVYLERCGNSLPPQPKKLKGKHLASNGLVKILDSKLKKYTLELVKIFCRRVDQGCSLFTTFLELDVDYQEKFFKFSELYRLLDDWRCPKDCNRDPEINILQAKHLFLNELFCREGTNVLKIVEHCLHEARNEELPIEIASAILTRLNEALLFFIDQQRHHCQLGDIVVSSAVSYSLELNMLPRLGYLDMVLAVISKEMKLVEGFSLEVKENIRISFLDTLLCDNSLEELLKHHVSGNGGSKTTVFDELEQLLQIVKVKERFQNFVLALITGVYDAFVKTINSRCHFSELLNLKAFHSEVFRHLSRDCDFDEISGKTWSHFESTDLHQASMKFYIKFLNSLFNKACLSLSNPTNVSVNALVSVVEFYRFEKSFTPLYLQQCLLRRALRKGYSFLKFFCDKEKGCMERGFCEALVTKGFPYSGLMRKTLRCLDNSYNMCLKNQKKDYRIESIIIGMNEMKTIFKVPILEAPRLPQEMQVMWESQIELYQETAVENAPPRKLQLAPTLNNIEISTSFVLANSRPLILEVNLLQAIVLDAFNHTNTQTFQELKNASKIENDNLLTAAIESCVKVGILFQKKDCFSLNKYFSPKKDVLRGNKLRIDFLG
ncbi:LAQU0S02e05270g1_1 [Lachancea quebecensis]|uniref:LAQU0S02e05270g1_1 n=1 Tax=Lachancea quebecensis TaxID=1654605 RepID=A0A0P1KMT1_9SACH|nr:LAQU0S02e05270g1_1 [Lachancea quebecensis]